MITFDEFSEIPIPMSISVYLHKDSLTNGTTIRFCDNATYHTQTPISTMEIVLNSLGYNVIVVDNVYDYSDIELE